MFNPTLNSNCMNVTGRTFVHSFERTLPERFQCSENVPLAGMMTQYLYKRMSKDYFTVCSWNCDYSSLIEAISDTQSIIG